MRKPEPLGTEFKNIVDGMSGIMLWLEVQEGKQRMSKLPHTKELGGTAACVVRGVEAMQDHQYVDDLDLPTNDDDDAPHEKKPFLFFGDSWFGSIKAVSEVRKLGHHACFNIKNGHSRCPKAFLETTMSDFPGGTWIVLEGHAEKEGIDLVCIGYKYNKKKVLIFVTTKGVGSTMPGEPYLARFPDKFGNVCSREVARPEIISNYFKYSNCVDLHNQARQFDLALEKSGSHRMDILGFILQCWEWLSSTHGKL